MDIITKGAMSRLIFSIMAAETKSVIRCEECVCNHNQLSVLSGFPRFRKKGRSPRIPFLYTKDHQESRWRQRMINPCGCGVNREAVSWFTFTALARHDPL
ncbi:hypothetical protein NC651_009307 [Populus alba x Populus x berolinensis]|nr:hypothetical protein NC651_009307 [Populus alba x Populus x berolinensis]